MKGVIGIAVGGTKVAVSHAFYDGEFHNIQKVVFPTNVSEPNLTMARIFGAIESINKPFEIISVICGGPLDIEKGIIMSPPHLPGFKDYPIVEILKKKYGFPVILLNDADACALAEYKFGAGVGSRNMAYLTFGTGIGSGLVLNGKLYTGATGMAGEIGHVRLSDNGPIGYGKAGSVEGYCAGGNISKWAKGFIFNKETSLHKYANLTTKDIANEAKNGDKVAVEIFNLVAERLGESVSVLIDVLNLDKVVIGGIYPRCEELLKDKLLESVKKNSIKVNFDVCKIEASKLKEEIDEYSSLVGVSLMEESFYDRYQELLPQKDNIEQAINVLEGCYKNGGKILVCGNGGSAADASHIVGELMKGFLDKRSLDKKLSLRVALQLLASVTVMS